MAQNRRLLRLVPLAPRPDALPVLVPDPAWWARLAAVGAGVRPPGRPRHCH